MGGGGHRGVSEGGWGGVTAVLLFHLKGLSKRTCSPYASIAIAARAFAACVARDLDSGAQAPSSASALCAGRRERGVPPKRVGERRVEMKRVLERCANSKAPGRRAAKDGSSPCAGIGALRRMKRATTWATANCPLQGLAELCRVGSGEASQGRLRGRRGTEQPRGIEQ